MNQSASIPRRRIASIDLLRGLVMVIMALDHVRDYFHNDSFLFDPTDLSQSSSAIFFTRFITHYCAPVFVFLAGTSAFMIGQRKSMKELSTWLLKRGVWLIIVEITIIKFAWNFKLDYSMTLLQVIWLLGLSMLFLAVFIHVPRKIMVPISLFVIAIHNAFDSVTLADSALSKLWTFMHLMQPIEFESFAVFVAYPFIPWIFVMPLGYHFGAYFKSDVSSDLRVRRLLQIGTFCTVLFFIIRAVNIYGDPLPWQFYDSLDFTIASFFNVTKYPPSLLFLLITLGPSIALLGLAEKWKGRLHDMLVVVGRVPMFYYIIHIYVIHLVALVATELTGFGWKSMIIDLWVSFQPELQGYGFDLWVVYALWLALVIGLYPLCEWYNDYKSRNRKHWWLSYL